jgi:hypothetical protein
MEDGTVRETLAGTPQGGVISAAAYRASSTAPHSQRRHFRAVVRADVLSCRTTAA